MTAARIETGAWHPIAARAEMPIVAIGDVHGCVSLMDAAVDHALDLLKPDDQLVLLGDLIDRGAHSIACLDRAHSLADRGAVVLAGNHEQMLLGSLTGSAMAARVWFMNGGDRVVAELGLDGVAAPEFAAELARSLGAERYAFLQALAPWWASGDVLCVHGGVNPAHSVARQLDQPIDEAFWEPAFREDLSPRWVRHPFLDHTGPFGAYGCVIFGHTPQRAPIIEANRLGLDLGSFATGRVAVGEVRGNRARAHIVDVGHPH